MAEVHVGYFLEDIAQERFLCALVTRVAEEKGIPVDMLRHEVRNASGGKGQAMNSLSQFLDRWRHDKVPVLDLLIVAIDSNCDSFTERRREIENLVRERGYHGPLACAVPDPHIERWYLADPEGFQRALSAPEAPCCPRYKCERDRYKRALRKALREAGVEAPLGGAEYGDDIVRSMDLYRAGRRDRSLKHFLDDLREALTLAYTTREKR